MKNKLQLIIVTLALVLAIPKINYGQTPNLGAANDFAILSTAGAVTSTSSMPYLTHVTGNMGSAPSSISGFGNVDGVLHQGGTTFANASNDINTAFLFLDSLAPTNVMASPFGGGDTLISGVHSIVNAAIWLTGDLVLDAQNNPNAIFVFQLDGALNVSVNSNVKLINGAQACNVYWMVKGALSMGAGVYMQGTIITKNGSINMGVNDSLVGRAFAINAAITVNQTTIRIPVGCGSPLLTGPALPVLNTVECYALFSSNGSVTDDQASFVLGDVGTNLGLTTGYDALKVTGTIHPIPDSSTAQCAADLLVIYNNINAMPYDIELMSPSIFGHNLLLTPHTYLMLSAVSLTDTLYLDAQGNPDAVFIFKINGAFATSVNSRVVLLNGAQAENIYWKIDGAVDINSNSIFNGTIVSAGAINLYTGVVLNGRALTTVGALSTFAAAVNSPTGTVEDAGIISGTDTICQGEVGITFQVPTILNATDYLWTLPPGAIISSGDSTNSITVDFSATDTSGTFNISVQGSGFCGLGAMSPNFQLEIIETPLTDSVINQLICNKDTTSTVVFSGGDSTTIYNWTNDNTSIGLMASGSGDIPSFTAINTGTGIDTAIITVTPFANGCLGRSTSFAIIVKPTPTSFDSTTICQGDSIAFDGGFINQAGIYQDTLVAANGCDSIHSLTLSVMPNSADTINTSICQGDSILFGGRALTMTGTYFDTIPATNTCDSIITLHLNVLPNAMSSLTVAICQGDTFHFNSMELTQTGIYQDTLVAANGCDSIHSLNLSVMPNSAETINTSICQGDSILFGGRALTMTGTYLDTIPATNTCDSIITLHLNVLPNATSSLTAAICQGDTFHFNSMELSQAGIYQDTLVAANGCDSILSLNLSVYPNANVAINASICQGETYDFNGIILSNQGNYSDTLTSNNGCDSIVDLALTVLPALSDSIYVNKDTLFAFESTASYQWLKCNTSNGTYSTVVGANLSYFIPTDSGYYAVELTNAACADTSICLQKDLAVGIANFSQEEKNSFSLIPNPTRDFVQIKATLINSGPVKIELRTISGRLVLELETNPSGNEINQKLDLSGLSNGLYLVSITSPKGWIVNKLVIQ